MSERRTDRKMDRDARFSHVAAGVGWLLMAFVLCFSEPVSAKRRPSNENQTESDRKAKSTKSSKKKKSKTKKKSPNTDAAKSAAKSAAKLERPVAESEKSVPSSPAEPASEKLAASAETAIRSIGVVLFTREDEATANGGNAISINEADEALCEDVAQVLSEKSYLIGSCIKKRMTDKMGESAWTELARKRSMDGILLGEISGSRIQMRLLSGRTGREIGKFEGEIPAESPSMSDTSEKSARAKQRKRVETVVDLFVAQVPLRGFVTRVSGDLVDLNLGARHGVQKGTFLRVFDFSGKDSSWSNPPKTLGVIEITEVVGPDSSSGRIVDRRGIITEYAKIAHEDAAPPRQAATARVTTDSSFWLSMGPEILTIDSKIRGVQNLNREYKMTSTPFVTVGMGAERWFSHLWYGYASDTEETLSYFALVAAYQFRALGGFKSGYTLSAGAWVSQYSASIKRVSLTRVLEDSTRYSPYFEARYQKVFGSRMLLFFGGEIYYPVMASGQQSSQIPFSFGYGVVPGLRWTASDWLSLEAGYRVQYLRLPLAGDKGTSEMQNGAFARVNMLL